MNPTLADVLTSATTAVEDVMQGAPDTCSLYDVTFANDGTGGTTKSDGSAVASGVKCIYNEKSHSSFQLAGTRLSHVTHELFLLATSATRAIKPNYAIVVGARGDMPQLRFEQPVLLEETFGPLVHVGAKLTK